MLWVDITYSLCEKIRQYKCVHDNAYFNALFGSEYIAYGCYI